MSTACGQYSRTDLPEKASEFLRQKMSRPRKDLYLQSQYSKAWNNKCLAPVAQTIEHFAWIPWPGVKIPPCRYQSMGIVPILHLQTRSLYISLPEDSFVSNALYVFFLCVIGWYKYCIKIEYQSRTMGFDFCGLIWINPFRCRECNFLWYWPTLGGINVYIVVSYFVMHMWKLNLK